MTATLEPPAFKPALFRTPTRRMHYLREMQETLNPLAVHIIREATIYLGLHEEEVAHESLQPILEVAMRHARQLGYDEVSRLLSHVQTEAPRTQPEITREMAELLPLLSAAIKLAELTGRNRLAARLADYLNGIEKEQQSLFESLLDKIPGISLKDKLNVMKMFMAALALVLHEHKSNT